MSPLDRPLRICFIAYRGNMLCGGQGVYLWFLARELARLGHEVEVLVGPPYPDPMPFAYSLMELPNQQFWGGWFARDRAAMLPEAPLEIFQPLNFYELASSWFGFLPEPFAFSLRAMRQIATRLRLGIRYDVVHDVQCLGWGDLVLQAMGLPLVTTIHHPLTVDRRSSFVRDESFRDALGTMSFYPAGMQASVARRVDRLFTSSRESARSIEHHVRKVSVMYADIRANSTTAHAQDPNVKYATLNRYTDIVSTNVMQHGGSLVEFSGDGIMAVFGAPQELPQKERAALEAARALLVAMAGFDVGSDQKFEVGIGVATGEALVGNIRSVDRLIWSAIGNTTNLAARLQSLSRDLDAGIVIDAATQLATLDDTGEFEHHPSVRIRGREEAFDIYALPRHIAERHLRKIG